MALTNLTNGPLCVVRPMWRGVFAVAPAPGKLGG